ncbi:NADP-dependent oxidoreductase domain-containing protein [Jimgerdemannia flammicorona]|uniref:NADP-dependent oxidoreductase domain-containing protein n=2 Tax=Jimgerdemannia flammicorona TaxID=994334 RepID=A0A433QRE3_9FUNG|nr:NADP-dependent oxidoreductase domain-containing protein [Jimgerdemannia flammicorona]RUS32317.1 NADP-dependent oxidoreductase domain-containing protein [Jimgerdemannia flammicorona]
MSTIPTAKLNSGYEIPLVGMGLFGGPSAPAEVYEASKHALKVGYKHFDTAYAYETEKAFGDAFRESKVPREDIFVTSKLFQTFHEPAHVAPAYQRSLTELGMQYLDLYLIHWPFAWPFTGYEFDELRLFNADGHMVVDPKVDYLDTWKAMEGLVRAGLVRSIGVSNFSVKQLQRLLDHCEIPPAVEIHPYLQQHELFEFCQKNKIHLTAYCPLGRPGSPLTTGALDGPVIIQIAKKHGKTPAQVMLSWGVQRGYSVVPKSVTLARIESNLEIFTLSYAEMTAIKKIGEGRADRTVDPIRLWGPTNVCFE